MDGMGRITLDDLDDPQMVEKFVHWVKHVMANEAVIMAARSEPGTSTRRPALMRGPLTLAREQERLQVA